MQADAEDKKCAEAFREYVIPVQLYNMLRERTEGQSLLLRRTLSYTAANAALSRRPVTSRDKAVWVSISLPAHSQPKFIRSGPVDFEKEKIEEYSVFVALCRRPGSDEAPAAFEPLCVQHMRVPVKKRDRTAGRSAPLQLPPAGLPDSGESPNLSTAGLHIVFIISCNRHDVPVLLPGHTALMQATVSDTRAFGFLDRGESVLWGTVPVLQEAVSTVTLQPGQLIVQPQGTEHSKCRAAISFRPGHAPGDMGQGVRSMSLAVVLGFQDAPFPLPAAARFVEPEEPKLQHPMDKLVAARMKDGMLPWGIVYFRFFTSQKKYATECTTRFSCPFCRMSMGTFTGLQQHLRASHDLFDYGFSEDSPMHLPAVSVEVAAGIYNTNHTFQSPEASLLGNSASKEFSFYCPPRLRQARRRVNKRALDGKSTLPEFDCQTPAAKRARLTHLATTRDVSRGAAPEDMEVDDAQVPAPDAVQQRKAKKALPPRSIDLTRFYHARTCIRMTKTEVERILLDPQRASDSDDEEDVEDWKDRCRRKLAPRADITSADKVFMFNWNCHLRTNPIHADWQVPAACEAFAFNNRRNILRSMELRRIFTMHLIGLYEFGLLAPDDINKCLRLLDM
ncbi:hypothetical protein CVIRNUC_004955 [Coccomyxa viridis]|uniref:C2H2-type domain-containing protein n=1 Tax=Coccomyxa viridis TaxID=1274662 RepID=A0AAV1I4W4_9CHLO|nr:hypothetical protein CVIRNUC_004955 [Coccomyxa viridis]